MEKTQKRKPKVRKNKHEYTVTRTFRWNGKEYKKGEVIVEKDVNFLLRNNLIR